MGNKKLGGLAYLIGVGGAVIIGAAEGLSAWMAPEMLTTVVVLAGLVIGLLNIKEKEAVPIMVAAIAVAGAGILAAVPFAGGVLASIGMRLAEVSIPVAVVVGINTFVNKAK